MLANLATATAADRQAVAELSISNAALTHEFRTATATIATLNQRLAICAYTPTPRTGTKVQQRRPANQKHHAGKNRQQPSRYQSRCRMESLNSCVSAALLVDSSATACLSAAVDVAKFASASACCCCISNSAALECPPLMLVVVP